MTTKAVWTIAAIALFVRFAVLAVVPDAHVSSNAENILHGADLIRDGNFVSNPDFPMYMPPLPALFVAGVQSVFGPSLMPVKLIQIVMDAGAVALLCYGASLMFSGTVAALAGLMFALYPFSAFVPVYIGTEPLFVFLLMLFSALALSAMRFNSIRLFLAAGFVLGLATLARGTTLFLWVFLLPLVMVYARTLPVSRAFLQCGVLFFGFAVALAPWVIRNFAVHDAFIPASVSGSPLLAGADEGFWLIEDRERNLPAYAAYLKKEKGISLPPNPTWADKEEFYRKAAIVKYQERYETRPLSFVPFYAKKFARLWYGTESGKNELLVVLINLPLYLFALVGLVLTITSCRVLPLYVVCLIGYFVGIHLVVFGYFRYMVPIMPLVMTLSALGILWAADRFEFLRSRISLLDRQLFADGAPHSSWCWRRRPPDAGPVRRQS